MTSSGLRASRVALTLLTSVTVLGGAPFSVRAQTPPSAGADSWELARQFAPVLVFHPREAFFPSSPVLSEECEIQTLTCARRALGRGIVTRIGDYQAMSLARKLQTATLYFSVRQTGPDAANPASLEADTMGVSRKRLP